MELFYRLKRCIKEWSEWNDAISWAKINHPNWAELAMQTNRPEISETYRNKIIRAYCDRGWK